MKLSLATRRSSRSIKAVGEWSVKTPTAILDGLTEQKAWAVFLAAPSGQLFKGKKQMASR